MSDTNEMGSSKARGTAPTVEIPEGSGGGEGGGSIKPLAETAAVSEPFYVRWWKQMRSLVVLILVMFAVRSVVFDWNDVPSGSMQPTILVGDRVFVNRMAYGLKIPFTTIHLLRWGSPKRGDIVVFYAPDKDANGKPLHTRMIKRVVGVPGDVVTLVNNRLTVNGEDAAYLPTTPSTVKELPPADQNGKDYFVEKVSGLSHWVAKDPGVELRGGEGRRNIREVTVPPGKYLMVGDNRDASADSRFWGRNSGNEPVAGLVDESQVLGRAWRVAFSLKNWVPRWNRFFGALYGMEGEPAK